MSSLSLLIRRTALVASKKVSSPHCLSFFKALSTSSAKDTTIIHPEEKEDESIGGRVGYMTADQLDALDHVFDKDLEEEDVKKTYAVDAPDGEVDGHTVEEMEEIDHIIEDAAEHEDTERVIAQHQGEEEVRKFHARDPEHDW